MRTSCDIDILVHKEDLAKAGTALVQAGAVKDDTPQSGHDISYHTQNGVHLELHFTLIEESVLQKADVPLSRVWEYAVPAAEGTYRCVLTEEMFLYYHLAHMAKHFCNGGCGIRPFLDLALLEKKWSPDRKKLSALLDEGGLTDFARTATTLSRAWFLGAPMEKKAEQVASYLLRGGVYGTTENRVTVSQARRGGKVSYAFFRLFPPFRVMVVAHPVLHKCPVLLPAFWVGRFFRILFDGRGKKAVQELRYIGGIQKTEQEQTDDMLRFLGLL